MRALVLLTVVRFLAVVMLCEVVPGASDAGEPPDIKVKNGRTVSLQVVDVPLNEVLNILAKNIPMEIRGAVPSQERITVNFSDLTLEEALSRIMRGYNYVLVRPDESAKALLVVMNRIDRAVQSESASFAPAAGAPVQPPGAMPTQGGPSRPGIQQTPPGQGQEPSFPVAGPAGTGQAGPQRPEYQQSLPGSVPSGPVPAAGPTPPFPGMPFGPGALPPGAASGPGAPSAVPGGVPPGISPPPGAANPPQGPPGTSGPVPTPPAQSQQPPQPTPEPARIMTPFGERSAE